MTSHGTPAPVTPAIEPRPGDDPTGEGHGVSIFLRDETVFHTYTTYARGTDLLNSTYNYLDLTPLGRQEPWEEPPGRS